jgi:hypothetical protein
VRRYRGAAGRAFAPGCAAVLTLLISLAGCRAAPTHTPQETMNQQTIATGEWRKLPGAACAAQYPDIIQFRDNGLYSARNERDGAHPVWDAGTYSVTAPGRIQISTANDAIIGYAFSLQGNVVTFRDPSGCEIQYRIAG